MRITSTDQIMRLFDPFYEADKFIIIDPIRFTTDEVESNIPDISEIDNVQEWNSATAYKIGDRVQITRSSGSLKNYDFTIFRAVADNTNVYPPTSYETELTKWTKVGRANAWRALDDIINSQTQSQEEYENQEDQEIVFTFKITQYADAISLHNLDADSVNVRIVDFDGNEIYNNDLTQHDPRNIFGWYEYYFDTLLFKKERSLLDIPKFTDAYLTLTIRKTGGIAKVGEIVIGEQTFCGYTLAGATPTPIDTSKKILDEFTNLIITPRPAYKEITVQTYLPSTFYADNIMNTLMNVRNRPAVYIASTQFDSLQAYGIFKEVPITFEPGKYLTINFTIQGLA